MSETDDGYELADILAAERRGFEKAREMAAKWHDNKAVAFEHSRRSAFSRTMASRYGSKRQESMKCAAAIRSMKMEDE